MSKSSVFLSYSHRDERWKDRLVKQLGVLEQQGLLTVWNDRLIGGGGKWYEEIQDAMEVAEVALLLISADFLNSRFILEKEVPALLKHREEKGLRVIPVIVKECPWRQVEWLSSLNARPRDGKALEEISSNHVNRVLSTIAEEVLTHLRSKGGNGSAGPSPEFLRLYRQRLASTFSRWDLANVGVVQAGGVGRPIEATLDDMYLPLRLAAEFDIKKTDLGAPVTPEDILARDRPLVIRGPAGSGKTTWMRWTFRRLLERDGAFPVMLVLRDLSKRWQDQVGCHGAARSLDFFLETWVADRLGGDYKEGEVQKALAANLGPRPVLLVDGWDETGALGNELREKLLGLQERHPRILIVVTSRPYGEGRPSHSEGFDLLEIQPLSDSEIHTLTERFFIRCYGEDLAQVGNAAVRFQESLARSPEAQAMARTALLLTMMLLISRTQPLPDKRHQLFEACIENLLTTPREREGALLLPEQWRPEDRDERMRVVAALAFRAQAEGYKGRSRGPIGRSWDEFAAILPEDWSERQRRGFLAWLSGPAGLLTDRVDGTLTFTHLSFQEYLAAWFLNSSVEGSDRITEFQNHLVNLDWWETLRLWAALIARSNPARLDPILGALIDEQGDALTLVGAIFADGLGKHDRFQAWLAQWPTLLAQSWSSGTLVCAQAWAASLQEERRYELTNSIERAVSNQNWLDWLRYEEFGRQAGLKLQLPPPDDLLSCVIIGEFHGPNQSTAYTVAASRILCGGPARWPLEPVELGLLHLWPGLRRMTGLQLQLAVSCGAPQAILGRLARRLLRDSNAKNTPTVKEMTRGVILKLPWNAVKTYMAPDIGRHLAFWAHDAAYDLAINWAEYWALAWGPSWVASSSSSRDSAQSWARSSATFLGRASLLDSVRDWAEALELPTIPDWIEKFLEFGLASCGCAMTRMTAALLDPWEKDKSRTFQVASSLSLLLAASCRLSLDSRHDAARFEQALLQYSTHLDPLWPALARHLARRATDGDRALLTDLAQHPERREPPLSWGLQFIVRGDILLNDGSVVLLDDLTDKAGLPRLPYLEEMPDELEMDWDAK